MALNIEIRRADYAGAGVYRSAEGDTRANLTGIKLQVDDIQSTTGKNLVVMPIPGSTNTPFLQDIGDETETITMKGTITQSGTVDAVYIKDDIRYASKNWIDASGKVTTFVWTDESDAAQIISETGFIQRFVYRYVAGNVNQYQFSLVFVMGRVA